MKDENPKGAGGGAGKGLLLGLGGVVLLAAGGFAGSFLSARHAAPAAEDTAAVEAQQERRPALYASLQPPLVVNFRDSLGDSHYMQVTLEVMARDPSVIEAVKRHAAVIRNALILLFSATVDYDAMSTREHKEQMLADALAEVRRIVRERTGSDGVEAVYFTSLIVQ